MTAYPLSIITPAGKMFDGPVVSLIAPGSQGSFGVLSHHAPTVTALKKGVLKLITEEGDRFFAVGTGVLEMNEQNQALVLTDIAIEGKNFEEAQEKLSTLAKA